MRGLHRPDEIDDPIAGKAERGVDLGRGPARPAGDIPDLEGKWRRERRIKELVMTKDQVVVTRVPEAAQRARLKDGVHIEYSPRRVRAYFDNKLIADNQRVLLVFETKRPPANWFSTAGVRV